MLLLEDLGVNPFLLFQVIRGPNNCFFPLFSSLLPGSRAWDRTQQDNPGQVTKYFHPALWENSYALPDTRSIKDEEVGILGEGHYLAFPIIGNHSEWAPWELSHPHQIHMHAHECVWAHTYAFIDSCLGISPHKCAVWPGNWSSFAEQIWWADELRRASLPLLLPSAALFFWKYLLPGATRASSTDLQ